MTILLPEPTVAPDLADIRREHGYHPLRVKEIVQETADTRSFVFDVPDNLRDIFQYRSGQFCTFRVHLDGDELLRCYSMSSAPETDADLAVTVKRVPDGRVSNWFHDHVAEGDLLEVTTPTGVFCIRDGGRPIVAFAGGSGVTPVISITKSLLAGTERPVRVLYANRDRDSVIFHDELEQLVAEHPDQLEVRHHLDAHAGLLEAAAVADFVAGDLDADFYLCGPGPFMDLVEATLLDLGVSPDRIAIERFVNAGQPGPSVTDSPAAPASAGADVPGEVTLVVKGKRHTIAYQPGDTVLDTARRGAVSTPFSCEAGNCATCVALCREGSATMRTNNALTPEEVDEGWVLTCQSIPQGATVTIEFESL